MTGAVTTQNSIVPSAESDVERIATLEGRSRHAASSADLHKTAFALFVGLITVLGGLIIHLHNTTTNEMAQIREVLFDLLQRIPGG